MKTFGCDVFLPSKKSGDFNHHEMIRRYYAVAFLAGFQTPACSSNQSVIAAKIMVLSPISDHNQLSKEANTVRATIKDNNKEANVYYVD